MSRAAYAAEMNTRYDALDAALVASGFPTTSPWMREQVRRYFEHGGRQVVWRIGRRGGKSSTLCRIAVVEGLYGAHVVPPGDVGVVAFISVSRDEASQRLRTIKAILDALGVKYRPIEGGIELEHKRVAFKVFAASVAGVSGFTSICIIADEVAKWRDADTGANPATEVLASVRPTMATQRLAKIILSSSPLGFEDAHAEAFEAGDNDFQIVAYAPTWVANPTISEEETHRLEPDARRWRREYAAQPQAGSLAAFDPEHVARAVGSKPPEKFVRCARVLLVDPTAGSSDTYAYAVASWHLPPATARYLTKRVWNRISHVWQEEVLEDAKGKPVPNPEWSDEAAGARLVFEYVDGVEQAMRRGITSDAIVAGLAKTARNFGVVAVHSDQFERFALQSAFGQRGLPFIPHTWTAPLKERAVERVRRWLADGVLILPDHAKTKDELLRFSEYVTPSGGLSFRGRQGGHDDYAMLVMLAALVDIEGQMPGGPLTPVVRYDLRYLPYA